MTANLADPIHLLLAEWQDDEEFRRAITTPVAISTSPGVQDEAIGPLMPGVDVLLSRRFTRAMAERADSLRLILTPGAGTNEIDFDAVPAGVSVCNVYGHEPSITEYVIMTMLALNRDLLPMVSRFRAGDWSDRAKGPQRDLRGKTVGILGMGRIGREIATAASSFGMQVTSATRSPCNVPNDIRAFADIVGIDKLHEVLGSADFVIVAVPLDDETTGLIGEGELATMKPSAYLINVARGPIVDERALYFALKDRTIAGAAIDVWYRYPEDRLTGAPSGYPFSELENVIPTPHIAGWTHGTFRHRWTEIDANISRLANGMPLHNVVVR